MNNFPSHESNNTNSFRGRVASLLGHVTRQKTPMPDSRTELNPAFDGLDPSKKWLLVDFGEGGGHFGSVEEQKAMDALMKDFFGEDLTPQE